ncbi:MAG: LTA synthase family protein [Candidatus Magasanikbacteria bacterium]|nr:LTA synthase family protein [Candidatus Magasanikbacteria bacterium]
MKFLKKLLFYLNAARLPIVLAGIFVVQNQIFNFWLHIVPQLYLVRASVVTFALGILLYGPVVFFEKRLRYWYLLLISFIISLLFISEYLYYSYYRAFLQASALKMFKESLAVGGTILTLLTPKIFIFTINFPIILIATLLAHQNKLRQIILKKLEKIVAVIVIITILTMGYGWVAYAESRDWGNIKQLYANLWDLNMLVGKVGIVNFFIEDAIKLGLKGRKVTVQDKNFAKEWLNGQKTATSTAGFGLAKGRNLIFIQVESLETVSINTKIDEQEITPNLNKLITQGIYFPNYFTQVSQGNTADAEFVILNSLYPLPSQVAFIDYAQNKYQALPSLLTKNGYHTYSLHGDVPTFWNRSNIYPRLGYQKYFTKADFTIPRPVGFQDLGDDDFFKQSIPKLKNFPQPFMATLITLSSHTPFELPPDLQTLSFPADTNLNDEQKKYLQSVHYADQSIGTFIDQLKEEKLFDTSLIVVVGDHGSYTNISQALGKDEGLLNNFKDSKVPLIIADPGIKLEGDNTIMSSHLDLYPTLANLLGVPAPSYVLGKDILNTTSSLVVRRAPNTGLIKAIFSSNLNYISSNDGVFENGKCFQANKNEPTSIKDCQTLYDDQSTKIKISDTVVRGNLILPFADESK